jgi:hypothetical protein
MKVRTYSIETFGYILAFVIAILIRFLSLARMPLTDQEATLALQALAIVKGTPLESITQPGYVLLTSVLLFLFGTTNFLARFWPALVGSLLVAAPFLYRRFLGPAAALFLAFFLALDPGLTALSREADGAILAVTFTLFAAGFTLNRRMVWAGICTGLALLGGPYLWPGLLSLGIALWLAFLFRPGQPEPDEAQETGANAEARPSGGKFLSASDLRTGFVSAVLTLLVFGTIFFLAPSGLSGLGGSLVAYLRGWGLTSGISPFLLLAAVFFYQPIGLVMGLWGLAVGLRSRAWIDRFLMIWLVAALILVIAYPNRAAPQLVWALLPLWALAARQLERWLKIEVGDTLLPALAQALLAFVLLGFAWMNLQASFGSALSGSSPELRLIATLGAIVLLILTSLLMGVGWSWKAMRIGSLWGIGAVLIIYSISALWSSAGLGKMPGMEIYRSGAPVQDEDLLLGTVGNLAKWHNGNRYLIDIAVVDIPSPSLKWALRDIHSVDFVSAVPTQAEPSIVITKDKETLASTSAYRGEGFIWTLSPSWNDYINVEWFQWMFNREGPIDKSTLILWARSDLFYGGAPKVNPQQP